MRYQCLKRQVYENGLYKIRPLEAADMPALQKWRNAQLAILRQEHPLTDEDQRIYWQQVLEPAFQQQHPKQILFGFLKEGQLIGYGGLTHIDWAAKRGEVSFLLETSRTSPKEHYRTEFTVFLGLLKEAIFGDLHFHRMFAETFDVRPEHVAVLEQCGFIFEGRLRDHVKVGKQYCDSLIHGVLRDE